MLRREDNNMDEYKHYENKFIKMTTEISEEDAEKLKKEEGGIKIYTDYGEFVFFPSNVITDPVGDPILYIKFKHKEKLVLYHYTQHPESRKAVNDFKLSIMMTNKISGHDYVVRDIMDYIAEIEKLTKKLQDGDIQLKDGIHPDMKDALK
jgi:hypothetical protein